MFPPFTIYKGKHQKSIRRLFITFSLGKLRSIEISGMAQRILEWESKSLGYFSEHIINGI